MRERPGACCCLCPPVGWPAACCCRLPCRLPCKARRTDPPAPGSRRPPAFRAGSGRASPATALASANPALITRRPGSDTGSPLGRYGAVGSPSSQGAASSGIGAAAEEALAAKVAGLAVGAGARGLSPPPAPAAAATTVTLAEAPGAGMLPPGWAKVTDGQGLVYYVNRVTQEVRARLAGGPGGGWLRLGWLAAGWPRAGWPRAGWLAGLPRERPPPAARFASLHPAHRLRCLLPRPPALPQSSLTRPTASAQGQAAM